MYEVLLATFSIGVLTKFADLIVDEGLGKKWMAYAGGIAYGVLIAYVIAGYPLLAPLGLAVILAVLLTKKIDSKPHVLGVASMVLFLAFWGLESLDVILLAVFLAAGVADEIVSDFADRGRVKGIPAKILEKRVVLDVTAFFVSFVTGYWIIFLGIFSFDIGYLLVRRTGERFE
ncbi:MAG: hypothetical protein V3U72_02515 [Candidatus Aenigmarchaeota archaeon]